MKFITAKVAPSLRDRYGIGFKIMTVDEDKEPLDFKIMADLGEETDNKR